MLGKDGGELVWGWRLAIEAIFDFAGERRGHFRMIQFELSSHDAHGTPQELFIEFFRVIRDVLRALLAGLAFFALHQRAASRWRLQNG
ncbi:hypothetical protein [Bradyrhizobium sp. UFLA05-112]